MARVEQNYKEHVMSMDRWGNYTSVEVPYIVFDSKDNHGKADEAVALEAVRASAPETLHNLPVYSISIDARLDEYTFTVNVMYSNADYDYNDDGDEDQESTVSFDCGNTTKHVLFAYAQRHPYGSKDAQGAIGWNGKPGKEMEISGCDVPTADIRETRTKVMNVGHLTTSYLRRVASLVGKVNNRRFYGWEKGESMFLGMSYMRTKSARHVVVSFHFSIKINENNVKISGHNVGDVEGHEYISAIPISVSDNGLKSDVSDVYVSKPWLYGDFSLLGV